MGNEIANKLLTVSLLAGCLLLNGCVGVMAKGKLEKVDGFPDISGFANKPSVYLDLTNSSVKEAVARATERSGLFRSFAFDRVQDQQVDYTIHMEPSSRSEELGTGREFLQQMLLTTACITPFGVPLPLADVGYTLTASIQDSTGADLGSYTIEESVTVWCGLVLLPFAPITLKSEDRLWENMVMVFYKKILDNGLLAYSSSKKPDETIK